MRYNSLLILKGLPALLLALLLFTAVSCKHADKQTFNKNNTSFVEEITIRQLQEGYSKGTFTVEDILQMYLDRIDKIDKNGPALNSVITLNPDALQIARGLDRELADGKSRGPLHGIPVLLKDNIDTHDRMPTTGGATVLRNSFPQADSWIAKKLRDAGVVIIGKTNLSEWANFRSKISSSGWSGTGGQTRNPYVLDRNPCGSSSGSGVAVSANLCAFAIGTETNGSIVCPSNNNGIVGLKPTVGLISRSGIIPISFTQDTPGPMARTVEDIAISLGAMVGTDPADSKTLATSRPGITDYTQFLNANGLKGKRIGWLKNSGGYHPHVDSLMAKTLQVLRASGAVIVEVEMPLSAETENASFQVLLYEFKDGLNKYFGSLGEKAPVKDLAGLIKFNLSDSVELRYFDQHLLELAQEKGGLDSPEYRKALASMLAATQKNGIDKVMNDNKLSALVAATGTPAWKTDLINGDLYLGSSSSPAAIAGYPSITVPMGFIEELPVGISFFGKAWSEGPLIEIAYAFEQATKVRKAPKYLVNSK